jgi:hypothetical protein
MSREPINHPAFPVNAYAGDGTNPVVRPNSGISARDFFAKGFSGAVYTANKNEEPEAIAEIVYSLADAMLEERQYTNRK